MTDIFDKKFLDIVLFQEKKILDGDNIKIKTIKKDSVVLNYLNKQESRNNFTKQQRNTLISVLSKSFSEVIKSIRRAKEENNINILTKRIIDIYVQETINELEKINKIYIETSKEDIDNKVEIAVEDYIIAIAFLLSFLIIVL